jgi:hypothetical protein
MIGSNSKHIINNVSAILSIQLPRAKHKPVYCERIHIY